MDIEVFESKFISGTIVLPGDKSISQRAVILASIAKGKTKINNFLYGGDPLSTLEALNKLAVEYTITAKKELFIEGRGLKGLKAPKSPLNLGNSGTGIRLLTGLLAAQEFSSVLCGDASLSLRPMKRVIEPLSLLGANIEGNSNKNGLITAPLTIKPAQSLKGINYTLNPASAQVKSAIILCSLYARVKTTINESIATRDHLERMLVNFSYPIEIINKENIVNKSKIANAEKITNKENVVNKKNIIDKKIIISPGTSLDACELEIPGDISSAAFLIVAALISKNATLIIKNVGLNPTRSGVITILKMMGANIVIENLKVISNEQVGDIKVSSSSLIGIEIPQSLIVSAIDEIPIILIAALFAKGTTSLKGAKELRVKETDRINAMLVGLRALGQNVEEFEDGLILEPTKIQTATIDSFGDHRIAMAFIISSFATNKSLKVLNCSNIKTSFPNFLEICAKLGLNCKIRI